MRRARLAASSVSGHAHARLDVNALMRAVPARDVAQVAADAFLAIDPRHDLVIQIQVLPLRDRGRREAAEIVDRAEAFFVHPVAQPVDHVFDDAEAVVHGRRAHLHRPAAQQDELRRVAPLANAADTRNRQSAPRDRDAICCTRCSAIGFTAGPQYPPCAERPPTSGRGVNVSRSMPVIELIVLMAESASAPPRLRRARHRPDVGDVRRQLHQHRSARHFLHPLGDHARILGHLPDRAAHAALAHAVRAAEVQLQPVGARVFGPLHDVVPRLALRLHHQRRDHRVLRIALLHLGDFAQVHLDAAGRVMSSILLSPIMRWPFQSTDE